MREIPIARGPSVSALVFLILASLCILSVSSCVFDAPRACLLSSAQAKKITTIEIAFPRAEYPIRLERKNDSWFLVLDDIHRYPANAPRVSSLINAVCEAHVTRVLEKNDGAYGIDSSASPRVRALNASGSVLLDLLAGNITAAGTAQYFQDSRISRTIRVEPPLSTFIDGTTAFWANLAPFDTTFQGREIERVTYKKGNYQRTLVRGSSEYEKELLDSFERTLTTLSCVDVTNIPFVAAESVTLELGDTSSLSISLMTLNENYAIIRRESDSASWVIAETAHRALIGSF